MEKGEKKMKKQVIGILFSLLLVIGGCNQAEMIEDENPQQSDVIKIELSDEEILVNGELISEKQENGVYVGNDIVYYEEGTDEAYGEGDESDMHSAEEANQHQVIHITEAGDYVVSGSLSYGQILVDLGEDSKDDPTAVVNLTLDNVDLTSSVASAILVVNAYECADEEVSEVVDLSDAGFNLILADGSINQINGSHVAKIYEEGTSDKKYKYDAAIESLVSFNMKGNGQLNVIADNEGIETGMHLMIDGGVFNIESSDDAFNASEDGISVITINDGEVYANAVLGNEGDGIDSNGWIVINGGTVVAKANAKSADSGLDADNGIYLNGGTVLAFGSMQNGIAVDSQQNYATLNMSQNINENHTIAIKQNDEFIVVFELEDSYSSIIYSSADLSQEDVEFYTVESLEGELKHSLYYDVTDMVIKEQLQNQDGFKPDKERPDEPKRQEPPVEGQKPPVEKPQD